MFTLDNKDALFIGVCTLSITVSSVLWCLHVLQHNIVDCSTISSMYWFLCGLQHSIVGILVFLWFPILYCRCVDFCVVCSIVSSMYLCLCVVYSTTSLEYWCLCGLQHCIVGVFVFFV